MKFAEAVRTERDGSQTHADVDADPVVAPLVFRPPLQKGRGAVGNVRGRFEVDEREAFDDGWDTRLHDEGDPPRLKTIVTAETAKTVLSKNDSPDIPFRLSLNPYRGCEHGCIYCFARPTHSFLGLSPGLDFESRLFAKVNAAELLRRELAKPSYVPETIAVGVNTDAYQPIEREWKITRSVLEVLHETKNPFGLITKSSLIERDLDLLAPLAREGLARASVTITTLDHEVSRQLEPRAASPTRRLRTIRALAEAGVPVSVSVSPVIPFVTDSEMEKIVEAAADAGATGAHFIVLRLPWEVSDVFQAWLKAHFPLRAERVMNRIRDLHGQKAAGKVYDGRFGIRMTGQGIWADLFSQRFRAACKRHGLNREWRGFDVSKFVRPVMAKGDAAQGSLF